MRAKWKITEIKTLMRSNHIDSSPASSQMVSGNLADRIAKTSTIGDDMKSEIGLKSAKIEPALGDFAKRVQDRRSLDEQPRRRRSGIAECVRNSRERERARAEFHMARNRRLR